MVLKFFHSLQQQITAYITVIIKDLWCNMTHSCQSDVKTSEIFFKSHFPLGNHIFIALIKTNHSKSIISVHICSTHKIKRPVLSLGYYMFECLFCILNANCITVLLVKQQYDIQQLLWEMLYLCPSFDTISNSVNPAEVPQQIPCINYIIQGSVFHNAQGIALKLRLRN